MYKDEDECEDEDDAEDISFDEDEEEKEEQAVEDTRFRCLVANDEAILLTMLEALFEK